MAAGSIALEGDKCRSMRGGETLHFLMRVPQRVSLPELVLSRSAKAIWPPWFLSGSCNDAGSFKAQSGPAVCWCSSGGGCLHRGPESEEGVDEPGRIWAVLVSFSCRASTQRLEDSGERDSKVGETPVWSPDERALSGLGGL